MMLMLQSYVQRLRRLVHRWLLDTRVHTLLRCTGYFLSGLVLSAASLYHRALPLSMAFLFACRGWSAVLAALGGCCGYFVFWGQAGQQGLFWMVAALPIVILLTDRQIVRNAPALMPSLAAFVVAASGVVFQGLFADTGSVTIYLLRVALAAGASRVFAVVLQGRNPIMDWIAGGLAVLSLVQIAPEMYLNLGYFAAGYFCMAGAFPAAALAGLALDMAQVTPVPMTAVLALAYLVRFIPRYPRILAAITPAAVYGAMMLLCNAWALQPLPGLVIGAALGLALPMNSRKVYRRGETGVAQVRLELAAEVMAQTQQLLLEAEPPQVDEETLVQRSAERACNGCSYRKSCKDARRLGQLPSLLLHKPLLSTQELPIICRKSGRFLAELHRSQEQLRSIMADRERQKEYRAAVTQQYRFMAEFLQDLSDALSRKVQTPIISYAPKVSVFGNRPEADNGDKCLYFSGTAGRFYVLLCDGMGTGLGAVREAQTAGKLLQRLLCAGYPAEYALRSLNSLCALRDRAGAVTVDLAEVQLDSGKTILYKWGAAPSYLVTRQGAERIGVVGPPPGLSVTDYRETVDKVSLRRGELLVLVSDGLAQAQTMACCLSCKDTPPAELARQILDSAQTSGPDDATVAIVRLETIKT